MLISIITVVYNGAKTLEQTIQSVLNQSYKNIEYIIIDGGSIDGTLNIIKKYENQISYWVSEPDRGLYDAMNKGILQAKGQLIGIVNSDDWYELNALQLVVDSYSKFPTKTIFHGDRYDILSNGTKKIRKYNSSAFKFFYYGMTFNHPTMFIHRNEYKKHMYNIYLKSHSDYQFILEAYKRDSKTICYIPHPITNYRLDGISSNMHWWESSKVVYKIRKEVGFTFYERLFSFFFTRSSIIIKKLLSQFNFPLNI